MILSAGLSPAWQQILLFDSLAVGEVNRAREARWCASGKVLNVGMALHHLGAECRTLSIIGGRSGESIREEFAALGVPARWIESAQPTRICTTILDASRQTTTELVENSGPLAPEERERFVEAYAREAAAASTVVLTGSLPAGTPDTFYRDLLARTPGRAVLDVRGPELLAALEHGPFLVKPNRDELARTVGRLLHDEQDLLDAMRELNDRGAEWVVVTHGRDDVVATSAEEIVRFRPPSVPVVNPIGCGDCLAAGIAWGLDAGRDPVEAIRIGMAAAAENLSQLLPARLDRDRVFEAARKIAATIGS